MTTFTLNSQKYDGRYMYLTLTQTKDIATNSSIINWTLTVTGGASNYYNTGPTTIIIGNRQVYYKESLHWSTKQFPAAKGSVSGSLTLQHDDLGELTLPIILKTAIYTGQVVTNADEWTLDTIERAATLLTAPDFNDEGNPTITYTVPSPDTVDSVQACITLDGTNPDIAYREVDMEATSYTFNLTDEERKVLRAAVTSGTSRTLKFYLKTVISGVNYYSRSNDKTFTLINATPLLAPTAVDTSEKAIQLTGNANTIIKGYNSVQVNLNATTRKEAVLQYYLITNGAKELRATSGKIDNVETGAFTFKAVDNRGNTTIQTITIPMVEYINLSCNLNAGIEIVDGTKATMTLTISGNFFNGNFGAKYNNLTIKYRYKADNGAYSDWITSTATVNYSNNTYSLTQLITDLDYQSAYTVQVMAADAVNTSGKTSAEITLKARPVFDWSGEDFNFNVPVKINNIELDYIVEQGEKNGWYYKKWNSGAAECWYSATVSGIDVGEFNLDGFYHSGSKGVDFPFTFKSVVYVNATGGSTGNMNIVRPFNNTNSNMTYIVVGMADRSSTTVKINLEVKGKWR